MNLDISEYIPEDFADNSRVWIYQASRPLTMGECLAAEPLLQDFVAKWNTHSNPVKGYANILFGQFIVLMADETTQYVSGCSTDSSVRLVKQIEEKLNVHFFDRQLLAFVAKEKIQLMPLSQLQYAIDHEFISPETLYFNNTVATKEELLTKWIIPVKDSWLNKKIKENSSIKA